MDITQKQNLTQSLRQEQIVTQKQIQALELLFLPVLELQAMIDNELEKNPTLELEVPDDLQDKTTIDDEKWLDNILKLDEENRYIRTRHTTYSQEDEEKRRHYLDSITVEQTFQEFLLEQIRYHDLSEDLLSCCEVVISGLDDNGYLTSHPADLAMASGQGINLVNKAISIIKKLDPPGVAAKDLRERLMIQLERNQQAESLAYIAIRDHLDDIAANRLPLVAKKMKISLDDLKAVISEIQKLNPRISTEPASPNDYISEEVVISTEENDINVKVKNDYLPNLFISKHYRELLSSQEASKETKDYIKDKLKSGVFLINSIIQRQTTIKKIVDEIVNVQKDFFTQGPDHLKPLTMLQVADNVGIHETTVSRAVAGKYLRCDQGLFPLKHFFTSGYETENGTTVSSNVIKDSINTLISNEDSFSPLSDSQISTELKKQGYKVARRTVAKYRESMNILPSNLRRKY